MQNKAFLNHMKTLYDSLKFFEIDNNKLILNYNGTYIIPFNNVLLDKLNQNLFLLEPNEIIHILYMLELLPKKSITKEENEFINNYILRYLKLNDMALSNSNIDTNLIWGLSIPIYSSYDQNFIDNPCSKIIQNIINNHTEEIETSRGNHPRLILTNPQFAPIEEVDNLNNIEKAGFTSIILISLAITITCIYIAFFIVGT